MIEVEWLTVESSNDRFIHSTQWSLHTINGSRKKQARGGEEWEPQMTTPFLRYGDAEQCEGVRVSTVWSAEALEGGLDQWMGQCNTMFDLREVGLTFDAAPAHTRPSPLNAEWTDE